MRQIFIVLALSFGLSIGLAPPVAAKDANQTAIEAIITDQIAAFQADDFARAFSFASPTIKGLFGTPQNFGMMVQRGYPMVYRPNSVRMLELRDVDGQLWQRVMVTDHAGPRICLITKLLKPPKVGRSTPCSFCRNRGWGVKTMPAGRCPLDEGGDSP